MPDAAYYRAWREAHPEYQERERERSRKRKRTPEQRRAERERAKHKAQVEENIRESKRAYAERVRAANRADPVKLAKLQAATRAWNRRHYEQTLYNKRIERARKLVRWAEEIVDQVLSRDDRTDVYDPLYEDALSCAIISLVEAPKKQRRANKEARALQDVKDFVRGERRWRWHAQELPDYL